MTHDWITFQRQRATRKIRELEAIRDSVQLRLDSVIEGLQRIHSPSVKLSNGWRADYHFLLLALVRESILWERADSSCQAYQRLERALRNLVGRDYSFFRYMIHPGAYPIITNWWG